MGLLRLIDMSFEKELTHAETQYAYVKASFFPRKGGITLRFYRSPDSFEEYEGRIDGYERLRSPLFNILKREGLLKEGNRITFKKVEERIFGVYIK